MCLEFSVVFLRIVSVSTENFLGCPFLERLCYCVSTRLNAPDQKTAKATGYLPS